MHWNTHQYIKIIPTVAAYSKNTQDYRQPLCEAQQADILQLLRRWYWRIFATLLGYTFHRKNSLLFIISLHCTLASCVAVYCNRSCLWVCDSGRAGGVRTLLQPARAVFASLWALFSLCLSIPYIYQRVTAKSVHTIQFPTSWSSYRHVWSKSPNRQSFFSREALIEALLHWCNRRRKKSEYMTPPSTNVITNRRSLLAYKQQWLEDMFKVTLGYL